MLLPIPPFQNLLCDAVWTSFFLFGHGTMHSGQWVLASPLDLVLMIV